jgi:hypothetical protein
VSHDPKPPFVQASSCKRRGYNLGPCTHWKAPLFHGALRSFKDH